MSAASGNGGAMPAPPFEAAGGAVVGGGGALGIPMAAAGGVAPSGTGGTSVAGGASGAPPIATSAPSGYPYDTSVKFDWPETTPQSGQCRAGTYSGQFACNVNLGLGMLDFAGPVQFTLSQSSMGEFLEISNGTLQADDTNMGATGSGTLTGRLDCSTNEFQATIHDGMYAVFPISGNFLGTLEGHLDRLTETLTGTWSFVPVLGNLPSGGAPDAAVVLKLPVSCQGTWSVTRQP